MQVKTILLGATNRISRHPVVLFTLGEKNTSVAEKLARQAVEVQKVIGIPGMKIIDTGANGNHFGFECIHPELGRDLIRYISLLAFEIDRNADLTERTDRLATEISNLWKPGIEHNATQVAGRLGIPWDVVTKGDRPLIALGQGVHRRLFWKAFTPVTSEIGTVFSTPKNIMGKMLHDAGLPVPQQAMATTFDDAQHLAVKIGWPVVVKPARTDFGVGITTGIRNVQELRAAFDIAKEFGDVLVQKHIEGDGHRLLVHNGKCISAVRQIAAQIVGDGSSSVSELIAKTNETRTDYLSRNWKKIKINEALIQMLDRVGLNLDSVPAMEQVVRLRSNTNISQGGTCERVTDDVHPANMAMAETAAAVFGLDLAGVDMQTTDIRSPLDEENGAIIEVNATPGWFMMEDGTSLEDQIVQHFFPSPAHGRIPIIVCIEDRPDIAELIASALSGSHVVAKSTSEELAVRGHVFNQSKNARCSHRIQVALNNPITEIAVISATAEDILHHGLGTDRVSLVVGARGVNHSAIQCLSRSTDATLVFAEDLAACEGQRTPQNGIWCLTNSVTGSSPKGVTLVKNSDEGIVHVRHADGTIRELLRDQALHSEEPLALQVAAMLGGKFID